MSSPLQPAATPTPAPDDATGWVIGRLEAVTDAIDATARADAPGAALRDVRTAIAEVGGIALVEETPPLASVIAVLLRLSGSPSSAPAVSEALLRPILELAARLLAEGASALRAGGRPSTDSAMVLAFAALVRATRPPAAARPAVTPIGDLTGPTKPAAPRPAAIARFRDETRTVAERLRDALARLRAASDPIASDAAGWTVAALTEHLGALAAEYGLRPVHDCLEAARRGLATLEPRALWVLDEAGMELAEPTSGPETLLPRFVALRARLDGVQPPPPLPMPAVAGRPAERGSTVAAATASAPVAPAGPSLAALLQDGIAAFTSDGTPPLATATEPQSDMGATPPSELPAASALSYRGPSALAAARALRDAIARGDRAATPATMDELHDLLRLAED